MDGPRVLSGSELVAKGVTNKPDGKLPELGSKEVFKSGTWLEQKQIQSALETRKHLIEVERIEKSGSISHALWREDLLLAEVTQQVGGYWQYFGHNIGKDLFLLPEETLFLIEVNCLLLRHNEVPVSLQKAYSLCLCEMSIAQYKVYASLSRLGYRVFRHKEPIPDNNIHNDISPTVEATTNNNDPINYSTVDEAPQSGNYTEAAVQTPDETVYEESQAGESVSNNEIKHENSSVFYSDNDSDSLPVIDADSVKVEIVENHIGSEGIENDINNAIEKIMQSSGMDAKTEFKGTGDEIPPIYEEPQMAVFDEDTCSVNENSIITEGDSITEVDQETNMLTYNAVSVIINSINENIRDLAADYKTTIENESNASGYNNLSTIVNENNRNIDDNANETGLVATNNNEKFNTETEVVAYEYSHREIPAANIYSVDDAGVCRLFEHDFASMEPDTLVSTNEVTDVIGVTTPTTVLNTEETASGENGTNKHLHESKIKYYDARILKLTARKFRADQRNNLRGFNSIQDFYQERVARVNVPDEQYLPRNIFLHRTAYVLDVVAVRNQNSWNVNILSDDNDQLESPNRASRGTDAPRFTDLLPYTPSSSFNPPSRFPTYRPHNRPLWNSRPQLWNSRPQLWNSRPQLWNSRSNYNSFYNYNEFRPAAQNFVPRPRYQPYPVERRHSLNNNQATPASSTATGASGGATVKLFHFNTLVRIAVKLKRIGGTELQVRAIRHIIETYNSRYGERLELTPDLEVIDRNHEVQLIVLDDDSEPKPKKQRLNEDTERINENLNKLKALAVKLKDLQRKNMAVPRHRRVFSNAIKTYNKSFNADLYLDSNFEIKDRKLIVVDSSSDSDAVPAKRNHKSLKRKIVRNPYNILKLGLNKADGASTSTQVQVLETVSLNMINDVARISRNGILGLYGGNGNGTCETNINTPSPIPENTEGLLKYFTKAWLPSDEDFGKVQLCSRENIRLDPLLSEAKYICNILKQSAETAESWLHLKISVLKDLKTRLNLQKQQAEALSNDFLMETESQIEPIVRPDCTDFKSALKQLTIISKKTVVPSGTIKVHFDVCNRNVHMKKKNLPKPNFRIICMDESAKFPSSEEVANLDAKYSDAVPIVFAFIGTSSISYLQMKSIDLPVFIPFQ